MTAQHLDERMVSEFSFPSKFIPKNLRDIRNARSGQHNTTTSLRLPKFVSLWPDTGFKKCNGKWVEKVSGLWVLILYISFIIKCE